MTSVRSSGISLQRGGWICVRKTHDESVMHRRRISVCNGHSRALAKWYLALLMTTSSATSYVPGSPIASINGDRAEENAHVLYQDKQSGTQWHPKHCLCYDKIEAVLNGVLSRPIQQWILEVSGRRVREVARWNSRVVHPVDMTEEGCCGQVMKRFAKKTRPKIRTWWYLTFLRSVSSREVLRR